LDLVNLVPLKVCAHPPFDTTSHLSMITPLISALYQQGASRRGGSRGMQGMSPRVLSFHSSSDWGWCGSIPEPSNPPWYVDRERLSRRFGGGIFTSAEDVVCERVDLGLWAPHSIFSGSSLNKLPTSNLSHFRYIDKLLHVLYPHSRGRLSLHMAMSTPGLALWTFTSHAQNTDIPAATLAGTLDGTSVDGLKMPQVWPHTLPKWDFGDGGMSSFGLWFGSGRPHICLRCIRDLDWGPYTS
jgi:hypothetical protein